MKTDTRPTLNQSPVAAMQDEVAADMARIDARHGYRAIGTKEQERGEEGESEGERAEWVGSGSGSGRGE